MQKHLPASYSTVCALITSTSCILAAKKVRDAAEPEQSPHGGGSPGSHLVVTHASSRAQGSSRQQARALKIAGMTQCMPLVRFMKCRHREEESAACAAVSRLHP